MVISDKGDDYMIIKYCIEEKIEVDDNMTDEEICEYLKNIAKEKNFMWCMENEELLCE